MKAIYIGVCAVLRFLPEKVSIKVSRRLEELGALVFKKGDPYVVTRRFPFGVMTLNIAEKTQRSIYSHKCYEGELYRFVEQTVKEGDIFVDVGANVGYFSCLAGWKGARVLALEPDVMNLEALRRNFAGEISSDAVGAKKGRATFYVNPLNHGGSSLMAGSDRYKSGNVQYTREKTQELFDEPLSYEVQVVTLDEVCRDFEKVKMVKIDVEGAELGVIEGMTQMLKEGKVEVVACEVGNLNTRTEILKRFREAGYRVVRDGRDVFFTRI